MVKPPVSAARPVFLAISSPIRISWRGGGAGGGGDETLEDGVTCGAVAWAPGGLLSITFGADFWS